MDNVMVGNFLRQLRKNKKISQGKLVELLTEQEGIIGLTVSSISKWEKGDSLPNIDNLKMIANFYHITIDEILNCKIETSYVINDNYYALKEKYYKNISFTEWYDNFYKYENLCDNLLKNFINNSFNHVEYEALIELYINHWLELANDGQPDTDLFIKQLDYLMTLSRENIDIKEKEYMMYKIISSNSVYDLQFLESDGFVELKDEDMLQLFNSFNQIRKDAALALMLCSCGGKVVKNIIGEEKEYWKINLKSFKNYKRVIKLLINSGAIINRFFVYTLREVSYKKDFDTEMLFLNDIINRRVCYQRGIGYDEVRDILFYDEIGSYYSSLSKDDYYDDALDFFVNKRLGKELVYLDKQDEVPNVYRESGKHIFSINYMDTFFDEDAYSGIWMKYSYKQYIDEYDVLRTTELLKNIESLGKDEIYKKYYLYGGGDYEQTYKLFG